jgi:hypothetical protein
MTLPLTKILCEFSLRAEDLRLQTDRDAREETLVSLGLIAQTLSQVAGHLQAQTLSHLLEMSALEAARIAAAERRTMRF